jgi:hypothetical protein
VLPTEFEAVQREYPILLRKDPSGDYQAVALLGLDRDENLFLEGENWRGTRYVPAVQQRGAFSIALQDSGDGSEPTPMIHVDLDHPRVSASAKASPCSCRRAATRPTCNTIARAGHDL